VFLSPVAGGCDRTKLVSTLKILNALNKGFEIFVKLFKVALSIDFLIFKYFR
jgi:hypothetical protein